MGEGETQLHARFDVLISIVGLGKVTQEKRKQKVGMEYKS